MGQEGGGGHCSGEELVWALGSGEDSQKAGCLAVLVALSNGFRYWLNV